jgi:hypothetical protein
VDVVPIIEEIFDTMKNTSMSSKKKALFMTTKMFSAIRNSPLFSYTRQTFTVGNITRDFDAIDGNAIIIVPQDRLVTDFFLADEFASTDPKTMVSEVTHRPSDSAKKVHLLCVPLVAGVFPVLKFQEIKYVSKENNQLRSSNDLHIRVAYDMIVTTNAAKNVYAITGEDFKSPKLTPGSSA